MADVIRSRPVPPPLDDACALFLDVDGTLVDFAASPDQVRLAPAVRDAIATLSRRLDGALALVSGRPVAQIDTLFAPLRLPAAGLHGHQLRLQGDAPTTDAADTSAWLHELHEQAEQLAHAHPGVLVEDKGAGLALHWRNAPEAAPHVAEFARVQLGRLPGYRLQPGNHVVEFVPLGSDKGRALTALLAQPPFRGRKPVYLGDDLTDEAGFAAVNRHGGWSVLVGARRDSAARYMLPDIRAVHRWLGAAPPQEAPHA